MDAPLVARYPASAAIRGLCGAFPTLTLDLGADAATLVVPDDAPVPPVGAIVDLDVQLDAGRLHAVGIVGRRHVVEDDAGDEAFAVDLALAEIDERGLAALAAAARLEARLREGGPAAAAAELATMRSETASAQGRHELAEALAPPPAPERAPAKRYGYWSPWASERGGEAPAPRGMRSGRGDGGDEQRKRPKPARHHWEVPDRFRPSG